MMTMRTLFTLLFSLWLGFGFSQGLVEEFDAACTCWTITNHYDNGQISMVHHENEARQKHGELVHYNAEGQVLRKEYWANGKLNGTAVHYHPDGSIYLEATYKEGKKMGVWVFRDPDGTPSQEINYTGKGSDGTYTYYYAGVKYLEQLIDNGKLVSTEILNQEIYDIVQEEATTPVK
jgi:antitoxin component YwqK of YwqJK toxin-antitoxin module